MSETIQRPDKSLFQNPKALEDLIDKGNLMHRFLLKQTDIDKNLQIIQRKVLKGTHLPVQVKEIQAGYLHNFNTTLKTYINICYKIRSQVLNCHKEIRSIIRKICTIRFLIIQNLS